MVNMKCRDWCFTSFDVSNYEKWMNEEFNLGSKCKYCVYQKEICPDSGKVHIQGYIEFKNTISMSNLKKILDSNELHVEKRKGKDFEARDYCMKEESGIEGSIIEINEFVANAQGFRSDLVEIYKLLKEGKDDFFIQEMYPGTYMRYYKGINRMRANLWSRKCGSYRDVNVEVNIGEAGSGKTRSVYDKYGCENVYRLRKSNNDNIWFDDYNGQKVLLIDDFYGWIKYSQLLELLDGYVLQLDCKGSHTYGIWEKVVITSNKNIDEWYKQGLSKAIARRVNVVNMFEAGSVDKEDFTIPVNIIKEGKVVANAKWKCDDDNWMRFCRNKSDIGNTNYVEAVQPVEPIIYCSDVSSEISYGESCCEAWPECDCIFRKFEELND